MEGGRRSDVIVPRFEMQPQRTSHSYIYLHGLASSPRSTKARYLSDRLRDRGIDLIVPDLNNGDFSHLTLTRCIQQTIALLDGTPTTLIGSSLGGLTAAWVAQKQTAVCKVILLAPAFNFLQRGLQNLGEDAIADWKTSGYRQVYHYGSRQQVPLHYGFVEDLQCYDDRHLDRPVDTLILHGIDDEVIPIAESQNLARSRPWVRLIELPSDHALGNVLPEIWQAIAAEIFP